LTNHKERQTTPSSATVNSAINRAELRETSKSLKNTANLHRKLATPPKTNASSTKIQTSNRTQISPIKTRVSNKKPHLTEQKLKRTVENGCTSTQPNRNRRNLQELTLWMGTGFTRPHGGRLMILPVAQKR